MTPLEAQVIRAASEIFEYDSLVVCLARFAEIDRVDLFPATLGIAMCAIRLGPPDVDWKEKIISDLAKKITSVNPGGAPYLAGVAHALDALETK